MPGEKRQGRNKRVIACDYCKLKKLRCDREDSDSCANCLDRNRSCTLSTRRPRRDPHRSAEDMSQRVARLEALLRRTPTAPPQPVPDDRAGPKRPSSAHTPMHKQPLNFEFVNHGLGGPDFQSSHPQEKPAPHTEGSSSSIFNPPGGHSCDSTVEPPSQSCQTHQMLEDPAISGIPRGNQPIAVDVPKATSSYESTFSDQRHFGDTYSAEAPLSISEIPDEIRELSSISSSESSNWEYHGPRSYLSICSNPGVRWVEKTTGGSSFVDSAKKFTADITRRLKIERKLSARKTPDPDHATAWRYVAAYFEDALDASLGIVHRPTFEVQLKAYLNGTLDNVDPAWHALRNAIYATGCRLELSRTKSFREANQTAWGYFENSLSAHTEILFFQSSITGVQALSVMAFYSQNIGSPCLEYMLCTNALRLAIAKGLHRRPTPLWNLTQNERSQRSCLFWAAYCLEKQIVSQCGRPSILDDDEINCQEPFAPSPCGSLSLDYFSILIKLAQLSSAVSKRLSSVQAFRAGPQVLVRSVNELHEQLISLKKSFEPIICLGSLINPNKLPPGLGLQQTIYLQCVYFNLVLDIHNTLIYPWSRTLLDLTPHPALQHQAENAIQVVADTCRNAILTIQHVYIDAGTPVPLTFFTPIYVLINLFICILRDPTHSRVPSALSLMDIGSGHFTRLQMATESEIDIRFARDITALAHAAVEQCDGVSAAHKTVDRQLRTLQYPENSLLLDHNQNELDPCLPGFDLGLGNVDSHFDIELEEWSTLLPGCFDEGLIGF